MKAKEIESLESYFKTENERWNRCAFGMLCEVIERGNFENLETPLQLFEKAVSILTEKHETPLKAVEEFTTLTENLKIAQKLFVYQWVYKYVKYSNFGEIDTTQIKDLLKSYIKKLNAEKLRSWRT